MNDETKKFLIGLGIIIVIFIIIIAALFMYSGLKSPLTVVESGSMEHSDQSTIGTIDTGDMVIMIDPNKTSITTYVEGQQSNYSKFGNYGDVIIYKRTSGNPIIHRAILYLDYNSDGTWSAPALKNYSHDLWNVTSGYDSWNNMTGTLTLNFSDFNGGTYDVSINLSDLEKHSGYLTKGDNPSTNRYFDQKAISGAKNRLIEKDSIKAVAGMEIPWLGCIKLLINNKNTDQIQSNSIPCLIIMFIDIVSFFIVLVMIFEYFDKKNIAKQIAEEEKKPIRHSKRK